MSWIPPLTTEPEYEHWAVDSKDEWEYLGTTAEDDTPMLFNNTRNSIHRARVDHEKEQLVPHPDASWESNPGEELGEFLERLGAEVNWNSLSEFARDHLKDEEN